MFADGITVRRPIYIALLAAILLPPPIQATKEDSVGNKNLRLRIKVTGQKYCFPDSVGPILYLDLGLTFTNISEHSVILSRKIESPPITQAAKSVEAAKLGNYEWNPNWDSFVDKLPSAPSFGKTPDPKLFVVLAPGGAYETTIASGFVGPVSLITSEKATGLLSGRNYVLRVGVDTWPYGWPYFAPTDVQMLSERWSKYGYLAYGLLYSEFAPFTVPGTFENMPCEAQ